MPPSLTAMLDRLIEAGIALAQSVQDTVDAALASAGTEAPAPDSPVAADLAALDEWEGAFAALMAHDLTAITTQEPA